VKNDVARVGRNRQPTKRRIELELD
jgi:hypothetical protein